MDEKASEVKVIEPAALTTVSTEAVSLNTMFKDTKGFDLQLTLRCGSDSGAVIHVLAEWVKVREWLLEKGATPISRDRGNQSKSADVAAQTGLPETAKCDLHDGAEMNLRTAKKTGRPFYSHQADDGEWCYGGPKVKALLKKG